MLPGAAMGVAARMIFVTFQMVAAAFVGTKFLSPLDMAGAALLGRVPLEQSFPLKFAALAVLLFYVVVSAACGAIFGTLSAVGPIRQSRWALLVAAMVFGSLLWLVNFTLVAQGAPLRLPAASPVVYFVTHTFFFGMPLALTLSVRFKCSRLPLETLHP